MCLISKIFTNYFYKYLPIIFLKLFRKSSQTLDILGILVLNLLLLLFFKSKLGVETSSEVLNCSVWSTSDDNLFCLDTDDRNLLEWGSFAPIW